MGMKGIFLSIEKIKQRKGGKVCMVVEYVRVQHVQVGDIVARTLYDEKARVLLREGNKLSAAGIRVIKEQGYKGIYIQQEGTERREDIPVPEPLVSDFQTIQLIAFMRDIVQRTNVYNYNTDPHFSAACKKIEEYVTDLVDLLYEYEAKNQLLFETEDTRTHATWIYYHSLNTCLLSIGICIKMGLPKQKTLEIALGAILHDIGKMFIPRELVNKINPTDAERKEIRKHAELGFRLFQRFGYSIDTTYGIWFHHEREDGSGYPNGVKGEKIPLAAKIVGLASSYDNMINYNPFQKTAMSQQEALEQICGDKRFNTNCVVALTKFVVPYPIGSKVKLSNGMEAIVLKNVPGSPLRPYLIANKKVLNLAGDEKLLNLVIV